jgi:predicted transcriptional regulator
MTNYWVDNIKDLIYDIDKEERFIKKYYDITEIYRVVISLNKVFPRSSEIEKLLLESNANSLD